MRLENSQEETNNMSTTLAIKLLEDHNNLHKKSIQDVHDEKPDVEDKDEDGGFDSFQITDNSSDNDSHNDSPSPDHGIGMGEKNGNDGIHYRSPLTFSQSQRNIPETELKQKANTVLDMINSEISELHMREQELKSGGQKIENVRNVEETAEACSEEDYNSDSAVDFESLTGTSNSSGSATPSDRPRSAGPQTPSPESDTLGKVEEKNEEVEIIENVAEEKKLSEVIEKEKNQENKINEKNAVSTRKQAVRRTPSLVRPLVEEDEKPATFR